MKDELRKEAERVLESATYSSESQFEYAKRWRRMDRIIGSISAALAAIAGVGGLSEVLSARWAGFTAVLAAGTGAVAASIGAPQTKEKASMAANAYRSLQQDTRMYLNIDLDGMGADAARARLQEIVDRLQQLNTESDVPSHRAWKRAQKQIEAGGQTYVVDKK